MPLTFRVASGLDDVLAAWRLVHDRYCETRLIDSHWTGVHGNHHARGPQCCVVLAEDAGVVVGTMTAVLDSVDGLPLDGTYGPELDAMRAAGARLGEFGLFAVRGLGLSAKLELCRWAMWFAVHQGITRIVAGIHPDHQLFYVGLFGFEPIVEAPTYRAWRGNVCVPIRLRLESFNAPDAAKGAKKIHDGPLPVDAFKDRYWFPRSEVIACPALAAWAG